MTACGQYIMPVGVNAFRAVGEGDIGSSLLADGFHGQQRHSVPTHVDFPTGYRVMHREIVVPDSQPWRNTADLLLMRYEIRQTRSHGTWRSDKTSTRLRSRLFGLVR